MLNKQQIPTAAQLARYDVVRRDSVEGIRQTLYDTLTYAAAGQTQLTFFQVQQGQGTGITGGAKTLEDTNMELAGQLPNPKAFLIQGIELFFFPAGSPVVFAGAAPAVPVAPKMTNDMWTFIKRGYLQLFISSKPYLQESPLAKFPARNFMRADLAVALDNIAAAGVMTAEVPVMSGAPYKVIPPITLRPTMNFNVTLNWGAAVALPSGLDARVQVCMTGLLYRNGQ